MGKDQDWKIVCDVLPEGWQAMARGLGALQRERVLRAPERLLRVLLAHVAQDLSLAETAARLEQAGWGRISAVAIWKRLRASELWLRWMAQRLFQRHGLVPSHSEGRILAVDATVVREPGATGSQWRVHWMVNLENLQCEQYELTDARGGENLCRFAFRPGDVVLADRGYSRAPGIACICQQRADVVVRVHTSALPLYDRRRQRMEILPLVRRLRPGQAGQWAAWVYAPEGPWLGGRLIVRRLPPTQAQAAQRRLLRQAKEKGKAVTPERLELAQYLLLWTTLDVRHHSYRRILRFYRLRWQIELVFKRLKSILGLGHVPKRSDLAARAWLQAKIVLVLLVERLWEVAQGSDAWGPCKPLRRSRWRETQYLLRELAAVVLPSRGLSQTLEHWPTIVRRLAEAPRKRARQAP